MVKDPTGFLFIIFGFIFGGVGLLWFFTEEHKVKVNEISIEEKITTNIKDNIVSKDTTYYITTNKYNINAKSYDIDTTIVEYKNNIDTTYTLNYCRQ